MRITIELLQDLEAQPSRTRIDMEPLFEKSAECRGRGDVTPKFFPGVHVGSDGRRAYAAALKLCNACEIRTECAAYAIENFERHGCWGGMVPSERAEARRQLLKRMKNREESAA